MFGLFSPPLYIFLFIYLTLVFICLFFVFFNFYHLFRFGALDLETVLASFLFLAVLNIIAFVSYQEIIKIDWHQPIFSVEIEEPGNYLDFSKTLPYINAPQPFEDVNGLNNFNQNFE